MSRSNEERELGKLLKEISFDINRIQKVSGAIEQTLREAKRLFQQIKKSIDQYETGRRLFLGQLKKDGNNLEFNGINQEFQNVADATPTPNPLAPLTPEQRTLIRNIVTQTRTLQRLQAELRAIVLAVTSLFATILSGDVTGIIAVLILRTFLTDIRREIARLLAEIAEVRENLTANIIELAMSFGLL